jgi:hypothetical protein
MKRSWNSILSAVVLVVSLSMCCLAQVTSATIAERSKTPSNSIPLNASATVAACISVEAVLLPKKPAAMIFSGYVSEHFAVVKTTISNHCANQQFILHNIFFDYSDWALSGVYSSPAACTTAASTQPAPQQPSQPVSKPKDGTAAPTQQSSQQPPQSGSQPKGGSTAPTQESSQQPSQASSQSSAQVLCDPWVHSTRPGQVATVGALDVQEEVTQDSVFSPRNIVINGLTLVGQVAGGYAFIGATPWAQGIGAYNSAFVPNLAKFWPDRRIDQEKFLLALGYRTDQTTVIAKQDHGSYYAFFPIAMFLTPTLKKLFLDDPAVFLNPAEAWFEPGAIKETGQPSKKKNDLANLRYILLELAQKIDSSLDAAQLLTNLSAPCKKGSTPDSCLICASDSTRSDAQDKFAACQSKVLAEKTLFSKASLNAARIVVRGVMTVEVNSIDPTIGNVAFDGEEKGESQWKVSTTEATESSPTDETNTEARKGGKQASSDKTQKNAASAPSNGNTSPGSNTAPDSTNVRTGVITGKYLTGGTPQIVGISVPGKQNVALSDYIADGTLKAVPEKSSDTSLPFTLNLGKTQMPSGTKLTFQVSRKSSDTDSSDTQSTAESSNLLKSNPYVYVVSYASTPSSPTIKDVSMDNDNKTDVWQSPGKLTGAATGTNLAGGTISVASLEITSKPATVSDYITSIGDVPKTSNATTVDFQLTLLKAVPVGSKITFVITTKEGDSTLTSTYGYIVRNPKEEKQAPAPKSKAHKTPAATTSPSNKTAKKQS